MECVGALGEIGKAAREEEEGSSSSSSPPPPPPPPVPSPVSIAEEEEEAARKEEPADFFFPLPTCILLFVIRDLLARYVFQRESRLVLEGSGGFKRWEEEEAIPFSPCGVSIVLRPKDGEDWVR